MRNQDLRENLMDPVCKYFVDLMRELFQFEEKYGYTASEPSSRHVEITWRMIKGEREILIMEEAVETFSVPTIMFHSSLFTSEIR